MQIIIKLIETLRDDPVKGPKLFLAILALNFFWVGLMQGINADLWTNSGQYGGGVQAVAEVGK